MKKAISPKKAYDIAKKLNIDVDDDEITFYATDENESEIWSFETKKERDNFINKEV